jgi:hypothetical protein
MNYWDEVKRIQIKLKSALSIPTGPATAIIDGITSKYGYLFLVGNTVYPVSLSGEVIGGDVSQTAGETTLKGVLQRLDKEADDYIRQNT